MNREEAEEYAKQMTYRQAVQNALQGKCIPYRKATMIKLHKLLDIIAPKDKGWKADTILFDEEVFLNIPINSTNCKEKQ